MRTAAGLFALVLALAGCHGHRRHHVETAAGVEQRLMRVHSGPLANPASATCHRQSRRWWRCEVFMTPSALGSTSGDVLVPAH